MRLSSRCEACRKTFKTGKTYDQHANSKQHLRAVALLRRQLEQEREAGERGVAPMKCVVTKGTSVGMEAGACDAILGHRPSARAAA